MAEPACIRAIEACREYAENEIDSTRFVQLIEEANSARCRSRSWLTVTQAAHDFVTFLTDGGKLNECVESASCVFGYSAAVEAGDLPEDTTIEAWRALREYESFRAGCDGADRLFVAYCLDIFSLNPYSLPAFDTSWRTDAAVGLALHMYKSRVFDRMPILADALEEAGCDHADILAHCRGDGPHVRGCWVVDLVLGKS